MQDEPGVVLSSPLLLPLSPGGPAATLVWLATKSYLNAALIWRSLFLDTGRPARTQRGHRRRLAWSVGSEGRNAAQCHGLNERGWAAVYDTVQPALPGCADGGARRTAMASGRRCRDCPEEAASVPCVMARMQAIAGKYAELRAHLLNQEGSNASFCIHISRHELIDGRYIPVHTVTVSDTEILILSGVSTSTLRRVP